MSSLCRCFCPQQLTNKEHHKECHNNECYFKLFNENDHERQWELWTKLIIPHKEMWRTKCKWTLRISLNECTNPRYNFLFLCFWFCRYMIRGFMIGWCILELTFCLAACSATMSLKSSFSTCCSLTCSSYFCVMAMGSSSSSSGARATSTPWESPPSPETPPTLRLVTVYMNHMIREEACKHDRHTNTCPLVSTAQTHLQYKRYIVDISTAQLVLVYLSLSF